MNHEGRGGFFFQTRKINIIIIIITSAAVESFLHGFVYKFIIRVAVGVNQNSVIHLRRKGCKLMVYNNRNKLL